MSNSNNTGVRDFLCFSAHILLLPVTILMTGPHGPYPKRWSLWSSQRDVMLTILGQTGTRSVENQQTIVTIVNLVAIIEGGLSSIGVCTATCEKIK